MFSYITQVTILLLPGFYTFPSVNATIATVVSKR